MKLTTNRNLYMLFIAAVLVSCHKHKVEQVTPPVTPPPDLSVCHHTITWDAILTRNTLIGTWNWEYIRCFWNPEDGNYDDYKGMEIEFKADSTLVVTENGQITQTSNWTVVPGDGDLFAVKTNPEVYLLYGRILICDDRVEFGDSYTDGCDNYFKRKN